MTYQSAATLQVVGDAEQLELVRAYLMRKLNEAHDRASLAEQVPARLKRMRGPLPLLLALETQDDMDHFLYITEDSKEPIPVLFKIGTSDDFPGKDLTRRISYSSDDDESFEEQVFINGDQCYYKRGCGFVDDWNCTVETAGRPYAWHLAMLKYGLLERSMGDAE